MDIERRKELLEAQFQQLAARKRQLEDMLRQTQGNIDATYGAMKLCEELMEEERLDDQAGGSGPDEQE